MAYFSGQGRVYIGARDELGNPAGLTFVGNVPELKVSLSVDTIEHQEAQSGQRLTDLQLIKTKKGEFACTLEELIATNLALALYGNAFFIEKNGRVLLMAENIKENASQLNRFKRAERGRTGAKQIKRGQEIPIAVLVKRVDLKRRLNLAGGVQRALPALARAIQQELDKV